MQPSNGNAGILELFVRTSRIHRLMLSSVAEFYEDETNQRIGTLIAIVEPAILVFMAIMIAFILISLYLPIFSFSVGAGPG